MALTTPAVRISQEGSNKVSGARPSAGRYAEKGHAGSGTRASVLKRACSHGVLTCSATGLEQLKVAPVALPTAASRWSASEAEAQNLTTNCGVSCHLR